MNEIIPLVQQGRPTFALALASPGSSLLRTTAREVVEYFETRFGQAPPVVSVRDLSEICEREQGLVLLGTAGGGDLVDQLAQGGQIALPPEGLAREGFQFACAAPDASKLLITVVGADDLGARHGAIELLRRLEFREKDAGVRLDAPILEAPAFEMRFWYVNEADHVLNRYHSLHWDLSDWTQYIDMVSFFRFNVLEIYPPSVTEKGALFGEEALSGKADRYLERTQQIIEYAHSKGLKVCITMTFNMSGGRTLCPSRDGIERVVEVNRFFIEALREADYFNLFPGDPGECRCAQCTPDTAIDVQLRLVEIIRNITRATPIVSTWSLCGWGDDLYDLTSTYELWGRRHKDFPQDIMVQWWPHQVSYVGHPLPQKRLAWAYATDPEPPHEVMPHVHLRSFKHFLQKVREERVEAISTNTWSPRLQLVNMFGASELMWNPDKDVEDIVADLAAGVFGDAHRDVGRAWMHLGDMYCKDAKYDKIGNHGVVLFILADGSRSRMRGTGEIFREEEDLERGEEAIRLFEGVKLPDGPPPFILYPTAEEYLEEYRYYAGFYHILARHVRLVRDARRAAKVLGIRLDVVDPAMPEEEIVYDDIVKILGLACASGEHPPEMAQIKDALKAIRTLDLGSQLEAYYDRTGLDREVYPDEYRKRLPTFLMQREFYEDPVVVAPHFRKLSPRQLEEYRKEKEARKPRFV